MSYRSNCGKLVDVFVSNIYFCELCNLGTDALQTNAIAEVLEDSYCGLLLHDTV